MSVPSTQSLIFSFAVTSRITIFSYLESLVGFGLLDSLVGFGRLKVSFYSENVILCENMKNSIFTIKSHFQPTVGYLPNCYRIEWLTGLGQLRWVG